MVYLSFYYLKTYTVPVKNVSGNVAVSLFLTIVFSVSVSQWYTGQTNGQTDITRTKSYFYLENLLKTQKTHRGCLKQARIFRDIHYLTSKEFQVLSFRTNLLILVYFVYLKPVRLSYDKNKACIKE